MTIIHNWRACAKAWKKGNNPEDVKRPLNKFPGLPGRATAAQRFLNND